jgi:phage protein D
VTVARVPDFELTLDGAAVTPETEARVIDITAVTEPDFAGHATVTLSNEAPGMPLTHGDDASLFAAGSKIAIKLGYVDALDTVFEGEITAVGATFPDDVGATLVVEAQTPHHRLRGDVKTRTFQEVTDSDAASTVLGDSGVAFEVESTSTTYPYLIQYNETDLSFLAARARRLRFLLVYEDSKLKFRSANEGESASSTLVWGNPTLADRDRSVALRRFAPMLQPLRPVTEVVVRGLDPLTREAIVQSVTSGAATTGGGTTGGAAHDTAFGSRVERVVDIPVGSSDEAKAIAQALYDRLAMGYATASGVLPGTPGLRSGHTVDVAGVGVFEGSYWLDRVTHRLSERGYDTSFSARSDSAA